MLKNPLVLAKYVLAGWLPGGRKSCVICGKHVWRFMPYRRDHDGPPPLINALDVIGSDTHNFECPRCGSNDRERHLLLYLHSFGLLDQMQGKTILHFAPEKHLSKKIASCHPARYVRCDLYPTSPEIQRMNLLDVQFADETFDFVIANHVLEHVADDRRALTEIRRVLKKDGRAILQTPYSDKLHRTWQDDGVDTDEARLQAYGQSDHVRLFGRDIVERFSAAGLASRVRVHGDLIPPADARHLGVNSREPFFMFQRID